MNASHSVILTSFVEVSHSLETPLMSSEPLGVGLVICGTHLKTGASLMLRIRERATIAPNCFAA